MNPTHKWLGTLFVFLAGLSDSLALWLVLKLWYPNGLSHTSVRSHWLWFGVLFLIWILIRYVFGLFDVRVVSNLGRFFRSLLGSWAVALIVGVVYFYTQPGLFLTPRRFLLAVSVAAFALYGVAAFYIGFFGWRFSRSEVYLLGGGAEEERLVNNILSEYAVFRGRIETQDLGQLARYGVIAIITDDYKLSGQEESVLLSGRRNGTRFIRLSTWVEALERRVMLQDLGSWWVLEFGGGKRYVYDRLKRLIDAAVSLLGLLVCLLVYPFVALAVKLSSPGPVLFVQQRVGKYGEVFTLYKFRSMRANPGNTWTDRNDARVTLVGRFLRRWRLDELPQFWNVLRGDMSLVGPRPEQVHIAEDMRRQIPFYDERHAVSPGLSGWAQLHVYASSLEETRLKLGFDLYYIKYRSFLFDIEIMLKTLVHLVFGASR